MVDEYTNMNINLYGKEVEGKLDTGHFSKWTFMIGGKNIIKLKINFIPRGLVHLKRLFDINYYL